MFRAVFCLFAISLIGGLSAKQYTEREAPSISTHLKQKKYWRCSDCGHYYQQEEKPDVCSNCAGHNFYFYYL